MEVGGRESERGEKETNAATTVLHYFREESIG